MSSSVSTTTTAWRYKERKLTNNRAIRDRSSYVEHLFYDDDDDAYNENDALTGKRRVYRKVPFVIVTILLVCLALFYFLWNENDTMKSTVFETAKMQPKVVVKSEMQMGTSGNTMMMMQPLQQEKELLVEPEWERAKGVLYKETTDALALHKMEEEKHKNVARQQQEGYGVEVPKDTVEKELLVRDGVPMQAPPSPPIDPPARNDEDDKNVGGRRKKLRRK